MVAAAVFLAGPALAQTTAAPPFEVETLQLNTSGQHGLIVNTGVILPRGGWRASLTMHLQHDPLVVRVDGQRVGAAVGDRLTAHLVGAWAPLDWLEIGAQLPLVVFQRGDDLSSHGLTTPAVAALGTPWLDVRGVVLKQSKGAPLDLGGRVSLGLPLGSDAALTRDSTVRAEFSVSAGRTLLPWLRAGAEVGFGLRPGTVLSPTPTLADEVGSGFRLSAGVNTVGGKLRGEAALRALLPTSRAPAGGELLLGARYSLLEQLEVYAVAGPGFGLAPGTPAFRVLLGVAYQGGATAAGPCEAGQKHTPQQCPALDDDGDGVLNAVDACPLSVGSGATKGCPDTDADGLGDGDDQCPKVAGTAAFKGCPDSDGDGLADGEDLCPKVAGTAAFRGCPDSDGDGIADGEDKCPQVAGAAALQGCPDSDGDGLADGDDRCPQVAGTAAFFGCPDGDGDGLPDAEDDCPSVAGSAALKGCPDGDGDGVADRDDTCPKVAGTTENNGCPAKQRQLVVISRDQILILDKVYFATGRSTILARSFPLLDRVAAVLAEHPEISQITVEGHTDNAGSAPVNRKLSEARADAVASYLKKKGVGAERLQARGYGPDQPSAPNTTPEGREANRRVEFKVTAHQ